MAADAGQTKIYKNSTKTQNPSKPLKTHSLDRAFAFGKAQVSRQTDLQRVAVAEEVQPELVGQDQTQLTTANQTETISWPKGR